MLWKINMRANGTIKPYDNHTLSLVFLAYTQNQDPDIYSRQLK